MKNRCVVDSVCIPVRKNAQTRKLGVGVGEDSVSHCRLQGGGHDNDELSPEREMPNAF